MPSIAYDESKTNLQPTITPVQMASVVSPQEIVSRETKSDFASGLQSLADSVLRFGEHKLINDANLAKQENIKQQGIAIGQIGDSINQFMTQLDQNADLNDMAKLTTAKKFAFMSLNKANYLTAQERMAALSHFSSYINDYYQEKTLTNKDMLTYQGVDGQTHVNESNQVNRMLGETIGKLKDISKFAPPDVVAKFAQAKGDEKLNMMSGLWGLVAQGENLEQALNMDQKRADILLKKAATAKDYEQIKDMQTKRKTEGVENYMMAYANVTISKIMNMTGKNGQTGIDMNGLNSLIEHMMQYPSKDSNSAIMQDIRFHIDKNDPAVIKGFNGFQAKLRTLRSQLQHFTDEELKTKQGQADLALVLSTALGKPGTKEWDESVSLYRAGKLPFMKGYSDQLQRNTTQGTLSDLSNTGSTE